MHPTSDHIARLEAALADRCGPGLALDAIETRDDKLWFRARRSQTLTLEGLGEVDVPCRVEGVWNGDDLGQLCVTLGDRCFLQLEQISFVSVTLSVGDRSISAEGESEKHARASALCAYFEKWGERAKGGSFSSGRPTGQRCLRAVA